MSLSTNGSVGRTLHRALIQGSLALDLELARCQSLRTRELDNLRTAISCRLPIDLRGLIERSKVTNTTSSSDKRLDDGGCDDDAPLRQSGTSSVTSHVKTWARLVRDAASNAPGLDGLDISVGFAALRHVNARVDALQHLVYERASSAEKFGIHVGVESEFQGSDRNRYFFRYRVRIINCSLHTVKLLSRAWTIRDVDGRVTDVRGPGVVGAFPILAPNQSYEYSSAVPLHAPLGTQSGHYMFVTLTDEEGHHAQTDTDNDMVHKATATEGKMLQVPIAPFSHRTPSIDNKGVDDGAASANGPTAKQGRRRKKGGRPSSSTDESSTDQSSTDEWRGP